MNKEQRYKVLGDFLKTRRQKISPSQMGLIDSGRRRTPGLRREEVAMLAGIGVTWYTWLEQGRPIQVSASVLRSLSKILMLDAQETLYMFKLAQQAPLVIESEPVKIIQPMLQNVLDNLAYSPAVILDQYWNIIAWNEAASVVFLDFKKIKVSNRNLIEIMFTQKEYQELFHSWELKAKEMIAQFRVSYSELIDDLWLKEFISSLENKSAEFKMWWRIHDVAPEQEMNKVLNHPILGELFFEHTVFRVETSQSNLFRMYVNVPELHTDTQKKIQQLN